MAHVPMFWVIAVGFALAVVLVGGAWARAQRRHVRALSQKPGGEGHNRSRGPCFGMCHEPQPEPLASAKTLGGLPTKHQGQSWLAVVKAATSRAVPLHFNEVLSIVLHPEDTEVAKSLNTGRDM